VVVYIDGDPHGSIISSQGSSFRIFALLIYLS
jgi:hypothetical protein